jgi:hypothetical protein
MKHKQNEVVYLINGIGNLDNLVDFEDEVPDTYENLADALEAAKNETKAYGLRTYVFKCVPVYRVDRGKMRITKIGGKS